MNSSIPKNLFNLIRDEESISISKYIDFCLYNSTNGYYQKKKSVGFDFITAPEVSQIFGECVSIFFLYLLETFEKKITSKMFIELGPGNGTLVQDILRVLQINKKLKKIDVILIEKSKRLRDKQKLKLENLKIANKIKLKWSEKLNLGNLNKPIFFYCNEFFDSLPTDQFYYSNKSLYERRIKLNSENKMTFIGKKTKKKINDFYRKVKDKLIFEYSKNTDQILKEIFKYISLNGGAFLLFDYGPSIKGANDSIQCIFNKQKCNLLDYPTKSDITHHIDFQYMKAIAKEFNLNCHGPISQRNFIINFGGYERLNSLISSSNREKRHSLKLEFLRLTNPSEMGELFKCILFTSKNYKIPKQIFKND
ncbi:SAM-dependent methyltransferase [Rickettsiales bacterium]|nr:SAM-dependent methyltransferase [Rickettsiales bacterium]